METNIYVGNLAYNVTEESLRELFSQAGEVKSINLIKDRDTGQVRGFAFVEMTTQVEAEKAIQQFNNYNFQNRSLKVNLSRPREARDSRGRGGRQNRR